MYALKNCSILRSVGEFERKISRLQRYEKRTYSECYTNINYNNFTTPPEHQLCKDMFEIIVLN